MKTAKEKSLNFLLMFKSFPASPKLLRQQNLMSPGDMRSFKLAFPVTTIQDDTMYVKFPRVYVSFSRDKEASTLTL
jgi:hypothetical protein